MHKPQRETFYKSLAAECGDGAAREFVAVVRMVRARAKGNAE
jgi:hypothetical protein